jgi:isoleucyl-tRNA synthetase
VLRGSHAQQSHFPADLYLEGSDQHRGWFHSSLLTSSMLNGRPPYKALLTHGFTVDEHGKKMSKSLGNVLSPQKISDSLGADILRLWVASTDYTGELAISEEILKRVTEAYRRIRNTLRFLLANTSDFDPVRNAVPVAELLEIDRYALAETARCRIRGGALRALRVPPGRRAPAELLLGRPGRLLPRHPEGPPVHDRRELARAPLGADRAVAHRARAAAHDGADPVVHRRGSLGRVRGRSGLCKDSDETIFTQTLWTFPAIAGRRALLDKYALLRAVRADVTKQLEEVRASGAIGSSLQAELAIKAAGAKYATLASLDDDLKFVFITSQAGVETGGRCGGGSRDRDAVEAEKCERCWHYRRDVAMTTRIRACAAAARATCSAAGEQRRFA